MQRTTSLGNSIPLSHPGLPGKWSDQKLVQLHISNSQPNLPYMAIGVRMQKEGGNNVVRCFPIEKSRI